MYRYIPISIWSYSNGGEITADFVANTPDCAYFRYAKTSEQAGRPYHQGQKGFVAQSPQRKGCPVLLTLSDIYLKRAETSSAPTYEKVASKHCHFDQRGDTIWYFLTG